MLARERRPGRVRAVAVRPVAGGAYRAFGLAGFGVTGRRYDERAQAGQYQHDGSNLARFHCFSQGKTYGNSGRKCISYPGRAFNNNPGVGMAKSPSGRHVSLPALSNSINCSRTSGAEVRFRGPLQCRQIERDQLPHRAAKGSVQDQQDPRAYPADQLFRSRTRETACRPARLRFRASVSKKMRSHWDQCTVRASCSNASALRGLVIVVDIRRGISELDQALIDMIGDKLNAAHMLLTKSDKLSRNPRARSPASGRQAPAGDRVTAVSTLSVTAAQRSRRPREQDAATGLARTSDTESPAKEKSPGS